MLMTGQIHHPLEKSFHIEQGRLRRRNPGKTPVILYKRQQPLPRTADGLQPVADFLLRSRRIRSICLVHQRQQGIAERSDGSHCIHDFVSQHPGKPNPGIHFLFIQLVVDVIQGQDAQMLLVHMNIADTDRKIDRPPFVAEHRLQLVTRTTGCNDLHQMSIHTFQLPDMSKDLHTQQPQSLAVLLIDCSVIIEDQDTGIYAF